MKIQWKTVKNYEKLMKNYENHWKNYEKLWKTNEKLWKTNEKLWKTNEKLTISELLVARSKFHWNSIKFLLKMDDFGAPGGQVQISFKFY